MTGRGAKEGGTVVHPIVDDEASLLALTNLSTVSFHRWQPRPTGVDQPDLLMVDLDPSGDDFAVVRDAALVTRALLEELDLAAYLQVTGSRGIHVVTPLDRTTSTEAVGAFARGVARVLAHRHPKRSPTRAARPSGRAGCTSTWRGTAAPRRRSSPYSVRPGPARRWRRPSPGTSSTTRSCARTGGPSPPCPSGCSVGDPWSGMSRHARNLRTRWRDLEALVHATDA